MGRLSRLNPRTEPAVQQQLTAEATLTKLLALFPDRATFEQWAEARQVPPEARAHMEKHLPAHLQKLVVM